MDNLQNKKNTYYNLIDGLSTITKQIDGSIDNLNDAINKFESSFNIDSLSADNKKISDNHKALIDRNNTIKNVIVPSLYEEINKANAQIEALEAAVEPTATSSVTPSTTSTSATSSTPRTTSTNNSSSKQTSNNIPYSPRKAKMDIVERALY